jgi:hypothetical protein
MLLHALHYFPGRGFERRVGELGSALGHPLLNRLPQAMVTFGPLGRIGAHFKALVIQVIQIANPFDPGKSPRREIRMGVGPLDEITPLVGPAEGQ